MITMTRCSSVLVSAPSSAYSPALPATRMVLWEPEEQGPLTDCLLLQVARVSAPAVQTSGEMPSISAQMRGGLCCAQSCSEGWQKTSWRLGKLPCYCTQSTGALCLQHRQMSSAALHSRV